MIKSNSIPARWVFHKLENNNTKEVFPLLWRFWAPRQVSQPGDQTKYWKSPGNLTLKASGIWLQDFHRTGGNTASSPGGHKQNLGCTWGKEQWPHRRLNQNYLLALEGLLWKCGLAAAQHRIGVLAAAVLEGPPWYKPYWRSALTLPESPQTPGLGHLRPDN